MNYVNLPNIPEKPVKLVLIDGRINKEVEDSLSKLSIKLIKTMEYSRVGASISYHPDIMFHHIQDEYIVCAPDINPTLLDKLAFEGFTLIKGNTVLSKNYPDDIAYNVARVGKFAFHNFKYTDSVLRDMLEKADVELVNIKQGYAKCSVSVINEKSIITADKGIAKAAEIKGIEAILIEPEEGILLTGMNMGFIGGSSGLISKNKWAVTGNISTLKSFQQIKDFLIKKGIEIITLSDGQVTDIGSIIPLATV